MSRSVDIGIPIKKIVDKETKVVKGEIVEMCSLTLSGTEKTIHNIGELSPSEESVKVTMKVTMPCVDLGILGELLESKPEQLIKVTIDPVPFVPTDGKRVFGVEKIIQHEIDLKLKQAKEEEAARKAEEKMLKLAGKEAEKEYKEYRKVWKASQKLDVKESDAWTDEQIALHDASALIPSDVIRRIKTEIKEKESKKEEKKK